MGHSSVLSYQGNSSLVTNECYLHRPPKQRSVEDDRLPTPPSRVWPLDELVGHIVRVHHVVVRQSLADLKSKLPTLCGLSTTREREWHKIIQRFGQLHDAILIGVCYEESVAFPRLMHWHATCKEQSLPSELLAVAKAVERSHAICLQMLWRLLRLTRDELFSSLDTRHHRKFADQPAAHFFDQLSAFCDDYERYLFEVECLLLPVVTSHSSAVLGSVNSHVEAIL